MNLFTVHSKIYWSYKTQELSCIFLTPFTEIISIYYLCICIYKSIPVMNRYYETVATLIYEEEWAGGSVHISA